MNSLESFTVEPLSAGDIIDRAVRLYRRNFLALLRIVIAPSLVAYTGLILYSIGLRNIALMPDDAGAGIAVVLILGGGLIYLIGKAAFYAVLGGSSRALVLHFFEGKPLLARDVYRAVRERFWSLIGATVIVLLMIIAFGMIILFLVMLLLMIFTAIATAVIRDAPPWLHFVFSLITALVTILVIVISFLIVYSRVVYVPQVLMVENKGVFGSIGRSFSLAGGEIRRIAALILFWFYVAWSLWWLMAFHLGWFGYWMGIDINPFNQAEPLWYAIAQQTLTQLSEILIAPIAMLGFTLLYLDSRVRKEGFDVELLANRVLLSPPNLSQAYTYYPAQPGVGAPAYAFAAAAPSIIGLGLNDYGPAQTNLFSPSTAPVEAIPTNGVTASGAAPDSAIRESAEFAYRDSSADQPETEKVTKAETSSQEAIPGSVTAEMSQKHCRWCGTKANVEDRFCRVCGSVF